ncbi:hypothetical protein BHM03_00057330 [Ensete ventricosum]|nr:hypothetical protein BHM03_00057330 [Ensete ventricosum]
MESCTRRVSRKRTTFISFLQCHARCRISVGISCTVSEIQNTGFSKRISP